MVLRIFLRVIAQNLQAHCPGAANADKANLHIGCLLYTSDAADDLLCVDLGGRRIIKKQNQNARQDRDHKQCTLIELTDLLEDN